MNAAFGWGAIAALGAAFLVGCTAPPQTTQPLACDDNLKTAFKPEAQTTVLRVKAFAKGEELRLENTAAAAPPAVLQRAPADICLVKLLVGPGKPGPAGAPATSAGIGIEVWLPRQQAGADASQVPWNGIIRAYGSGGWAGGFHADPTRLDKGNSASSNLTFGHYVAAVGKGYVASTSDHGNARVGNASFLFNEDGSTNTVGWQDFSERSMLVQAQATKALVRAYYGKPHRYAYFDGYSTGGRQAYKIAQKYPQLYDGILAGAPAFNWTRFIIGELYPQVLMQQELGGPIAVPKLHAASAAANRACGGGTLGFQLDPLACRYDPRKDATLLCSGAAGVGVTGTNPSPGVCLTAAEARVLNAIWYGITRDGLAPDPALDNGGAPSSLSANHLWFGLTRGSNLGALAGPVPFPIASAVVAQALLDPGMVQTVPAGLVVNAAGSNLAQDGWKRLDAASLARAFDQGLALQAAFGHINTDEPNLSAARDRGVKILSYHGLADQLIPPQGSVHYFERLVAAMGGLATVQSFNRLYFIPPYAHDGGTFSTTGSIDPTTGNPVALAKAPLPQPASGRDELFTALRQWVENGQAPGRIDVSSADAAVSIPICVHPRKAVQTGPVATAAASYECR